MADSSGRTDGGWNAPTRNRLRAYAEWMTFIDVAVVASLLMGVVGAFLWDSPAFRRVVLILVILGPLVIALRRRA